MRKMLFFACLLLGLSACEKDPDMNQLDADLVVYTDYDKDADFGGYKTYFLPDSILEAGGHRATYWKDENAKPMWACSFPTWLRQLRSLPVATGAAGGIMVSGVPGPDGIIRIPYPIPIIPIPW